MASVMSQCEQVGATALLPNSAGQRGQDTASLPDNTPEVCGCWTRWMIRSLTPAQLDAVIANVDQGGPVISLTGTSAAATSSFLSALGRFVPALSSCILGQTPNTTSSTSSAATTATSSAATSTASSVASSRPATGQGATTCPGSVNPGGTYNADSNYGLVTNIRAIGVPCSVADHVTEQYATVGFGDSGPVSADGYTCTRASLQVTCSPSSPSESEGAVSFTLIQQ